jgi:hypothetical protein
VGPGFFPLDEELQLLPGHFSPYLREAIVRLGTWLPFERVPEALQFFTRVQISADTARRVTQQAGRALEAVEAAEVEQLERDLPPPPAGPALQQLSVDGAMVPLVHGQWAEVKTLAVGTVETRAGVPHATALSYFSRRAEAGEFTRLALGELHRRGTETAGVVCAVQDGAEWLQSFVEHHCPAAVRILDFPHAAEHLSLAAQAVWGPGSAVASEWLGLQLHELKYGDPDRVLAGLHQLPTSEATDAQAAAQTVAQVTSYLEKRRPQLDYAAFQAAGYPIGSGLVESANKLVVEARLKGSGMHWAPASINPMVALRGAACSDRWAARWPQLTDHLQAQRGARRAARHPRPQPAPPPRAPDPSTRDCPTSVALPPKGLMHDGHPTRYHPFHRANLLPASSAKS